MKGVPAVPDVRVDMGPSIFPDAEGDKGKSRVLSAAGEERNAAMAKRNVVLILAESGPDERLVKTVASCGYQPAVVGSGRQAFEFLYQNSGKTAAVILSFVQPADAAAKLISALRDSPVYCMIPLIVAAGMSSRETEQACFTLGAWDYLAWPCPTELFQRRLSNAIAHSSLTVIDGLQNRLDFDTVSGIYTKEHFFSAAKRMIDRNPAEKFALVHCDIEKFHLVNSFFGTEEGDKLIRHIANLLREESRRHSFFAYGHIVADVFACCLAVSSREELVQMAVSARKILAEYPLTFSLLPVFGFAFLTDNSADVRTMFDNAALASRYCKGNYIKNFAFYENAMGDKLIQEQCIANDMVPALEKGQFELYFQPKYDLRTGMVSGAEALVRWNHPEQGMIPPGEFIPAFERNGFITRLDYYVWEHACAFLRRWLDEGKKVFPISVNISRVDFFAPKLVERICSLVRRYRISPALLQLELTESAYTSSPETIKKTMYDLRENGFTILMDDFGKGYSSLNVLKDIAVDVLKIDMEFLSGSDTPGRGENILDSVVRMARWLNIPVIAEGVETKEQVRFLSQIGCEFVQGYYFAKPMPAEEYERLLSVPNPEPRMEVEEKDEINTDRIWSVSSELESLFSSLVQPLALYEFEGGCADVLRVNYAYKKLFGFTGFGETGGACMERVVPEDRPKLLAMFRDAVSTHGASACEFRRIAEDGRTIWVGAKLKYIRFVGPKAVMIGSLTDITAQKRIEKELQKYRSAFWASEACRARILVVSDTEAGQTLENIFRDDFSVVRARSGEEGLAALRNSEKRISLVLVDLEGGAMNSTAFLRAKAENAELYRIPAVVIIGENSEKNQTAALSAGAKDLILKPFTPAAVRKRVDNILQAALVPGDEEKKEALPAV